MKSVIPATETSRADSAGTWREKESILTSAKRSRWKRKEDRERSCKLGFSSWVIILEGHPAQWASVLDEFCGPVNYKRKRRDFVLGGKKKIRRGKSKRNF